MISLIAVATVSLLAPLVPGPILPAQPSANMQEDAPDEKLIQATLDDLKLAFKKTTEITERLASIDRASKIPSDQVALALNPGLKDKELEVVNATLAVLAKMDVEKALAQLISFYKKDRRLKKDEALLINTIKAIGWHASPKAVDILREDVFSSPSRKVAQARILSLGRIRTTESVQATINLMKSMGRKKIQPYMGELSLTLTVLTGVDHGKDQDRWISWWNDNKRKLEVTEAASEIAKPLQRKWDNFWGIRPERPRGKKREERGDDEG